MSIVPVAVGIECKLLQPIQQLGVVSTFDCRLEINKLSSSFLNEFAHYLMRIL